MPSTTATLQQQSTGVGRSTLKLQSLSVDKQHQCGAMCGESHAAEAGNCTKSTQCERLQLCVIQAV